MVDGVVKPDRCVRVGTWNVWWAKTGLKRAPLVAEILAAPDCDVLCVTEVGDPPGMAPGDLIDHIAHSEDLTPHQAKPSPTDVRCVGIFPREQDGRTLSDHTGVWLDLKKA